MECCQLGNGGGWPMTFADVATGADFLRGIADQYALDLSHVVAMGHSSGGIWPCGSRGVTACQQRVPSVSRQRYRSTGWFPERAFPTSQTESNGIVVAVLVAAHARISSAAPPQPCRSGISRPRRARYGPEGCRNGTLWAATMPGGKQSVHAMSAPSIVDGLSSSVAGGACRVFARCSSRETSVRAGTPLTVWNTLA
jgi:hypothetical protein